MQAKDFQSDDLFTQIQGLVDTLEAERDAREAAEAADAAKTCLLSIIDREFRVPMEAVMATAEALLATQLNSSQRRYTETLAQSAVSLLATVNDVLDFSELESGEAELEHQKLDLHALVRNVAAVLQTRASLKGLTAGIDMAANCPRFILGDEGRIRQVIMSLIETALESTAEGSVRLFVSAGDAEPLTLRFDITDTGTGFGDEELNEMFEPKADTSSSLELPISRRLAVAMGGNVGCDSKLGQGSLYWFTLQTARAQDESEPEEETGEDSAPQGTLAGHVLVVEDNMVNRMMIGAYLDEFGLTYEMVENGSAAVMCLAVRTYDLVLMDMVLPDYDGLAIATRVRRLQAPSAQVPIVALAALGAEDDDQDYLAAGINARVAKPVRGRALYAALAPFLAAQDCGQAYASAC